VTQPRLKRSGNGPTLNKREKCRDESRGIFLFCVNNPASIGVKCSEAVNVDVLSPMRH